MAKFEKGQSGNPGGRPADIAAVRELARGKTEQAINTLAKIATAGKSEAARVSAAVALLDRGWGKAPQAITGEGGEGPVLTSIEVRFVEPDGRVVGLDD